VTQNDDIQKADQQQELRGFASLPRFLWTARQACDSSRYGKADEQDDRQGDDPESHENGGLHLLDGAID
jgi:hypothetical protein